MTEEVVAPGWYALLVGEPLDLEDWCYCLNQPFDPVALKLSQGRTGLWSRDFEDAADAESVRTRALVLIARMNGALAISNGTNPVRFNGVLNIDCDGREHTTIFVEGASLRLGRVVGRATAVVLGPDGEPLPPPPPQPSPPQLWNELAASNDDVSDLLDQFGRADNWYDFYKTAEIAAHLCGGKHKLRRVLDEQAGVFEKAVRTANFHRHARAELPVNPPTLDEAKPLLAWAVRRVVEAKLNSKALS